MSREDGMITESDLHAYADGVLEGEARAAVERYLAGNPAQAEKVEDWRRQNEALRSLYGHVAGEAVPERLRVRRIAQDPKAGLGDWRRLAAAAVLLLAAGAAGGWYGRELFPSAPPAGAPLVSEAVAAHGLYSGEVIHPVEVRADQKPHLQAWLSKRLERTLTVPDLRAEGLDLIGGRLLPADGGPAAQFMYEDEAGRRVTLYIIPARDGRESSFRYASFNDLKSLFWTDGAISCVLVGDLPRARLRTIATQAYRQLSPDG